MILKVNLDKSEDSADAEDPDDPEERGGDWEVLHQVLHRALLLPTPTIQVRKSIFW